MQKILTLTIIGSALALGGCSGATQSTSAQSSLLPRSGTHSGSNVRAHRSSWMKPGVKGDNLLYVSNYVPSASFVTVFSYPQGQVVGQLNGFALPLGECADAAGDVWITDYDNNDVVEYAHGGTSPIATLTVDNANSCSVDPTTGNLAVTTGPDDQIWIFPDASGNPTIYEDANFSSVAYCGYDSSGNLYVDGPSSGSAPFLLARLPAGGSSFSQVVLNQPIEQAGDLQWDGKFLALFDPSTTNVIYRFAMSPSSGGILIGSTTLTAVTGLGQFWIQGKRIVAPDGPLDGFTFLYHYPAGGSPIRAISGAREAYGAAVSKGG
jgi:hypothetical protein